MGAPPPDQWRQPTPDSMPPPHRKQQEPTGDNVRGQSSQIEGVPPGYVYIHTPLLNAQFFNLDAYGKDSKHN